jgi:hypothetical protein
MPWEYKKRAGGTKFGNVRSPVLKQALLTDTWVFQNSDKVLWTMTQILALDPCRRFTFRVTVEHTGMHIWFCDRSSFGTN